MRISGLIKNSFVDYPGEIAIVFFTPYCNMNCFYCHNRQLIENPPVDYEEKEIFDLLLEKKDKIDAVVITGGEPTIQLDLKEFIKKVKALGYMIKLDTNGSNPNVVEDLLKSNLLDYVAIDYKCPQDKYEEITGYKSANNVLKTINVLKTSKVPYEIRTTVCPTLTHEDLKIMEKELGSVCKRTFNKYRIPEIYKKEDENRVLEKPIDYV